MNETAKSMKRRYNIGDFHHYFHGVGIDVGAGGSGLSQFQHAFPRIVDVFELDQHNGNAETLEHHRDNSYEFLHSSHCLEHLQDPGAALGHWVRVVKHGGHLIITVPDFALYERHQWPSRFSGEHIWAFTMNWNFISGGYGTDKEVPIIFAPDFFGKREDVVIERMCLVSEFFEPRDVRDQTLLANPECAIEVVLRKL